eukprot:scaffold67284_cov66-Phaeocystis_antarctica.AAC.6
MLGRVSGSGGDASVVAGRVPNVGADREVPDRSIRLRHLGLKLTDQARGAAVAAIVGDDDFVGKAGLLACKRFKHQPQLDRVAKDEHNHRKHRSPRQSTFCDAQRREGGGRGGWVRARLLELTLRFQVRTQRVKVAARAVMHMHLQSGGERWPGRCRELLLVAASAEGIAQLNVMGHAARVDVAREGLRERAPLLGAGPRGQAFAPLDQGSWTVEGFALLATTRVVVIEQLPEETRRAVSTEQRADIRIARGVAARAWTWTWALHVRRTWTQGASRSPRCARAYLREAYRHDAPLAVKPAAHARRLTRSWRQSPRRAARRGASPASCVPAHGHGGVSYDASRVLPGTGRGGEASLFSARWAVAVGPSRQPSGAVGEGSRESVAVPRAAKGWAQATSNPNPN